MRLRGFSKLAGGMNRSVDCGGEFSILEVLLACGAFVALSSLFLGRSESRGPRLEFCVLWYLLVLCPFMPRCSPRKHLKDDKLSDEDFVAAKGGSGSSRKSKGRVRPRKSGGDGSDGEGGGRGRKKKPKRRRPASPSPSDGAGSDGGGGGDLSSGGEKATGSSGGNNAKKAKHGGIAPGQAKARALAVVRNFVASLPPVEYGRDEGWIASKEEARAAASSKGGGSGGGNKRERAAGGGSGEKGEKKPKKMKASSREEREREERERKDRLSQVGIPRAGRGGACKAQEKTFFARTGRSRVLRGCFCCLLVAAEPPERFCFM